MRLWEGKRLRTYSRAYALENLAYRLGCVQGRITLAVKTAPCGGCAVALASIARSAIRAAIRSAFTLRGVSDRKLAAIIAPFPAFALLALRRADNRATVNSPVPYPPNMGMVRLTVKTYQLCETLIATLGGTLPATQAGHARQDQLCRGRANTRCSSVTDVNTPETQVW